MEFSVNEWLAIWDLVMLHASLPKLRIGKQLEDAKPKPKPNKTKDSGGDLPNFPKILFNEPKNFAFALWKSHLKDKSVCHKW